MPLSVLALSALTLVFAVYLVGEVALYDADSRQDECG